MKKIKSVSLILLLVITTTVSAQLRRANKYYDNYDYAKAIDIYKKLARRGEDQEVLEKIASCYRLTRNYPEAEKYYSRLITIPGINPINHFFYGEVLKNNKKIDEAKDQFLIYLKLVPNDKKVEESVKSCDEIKLWVKKTQRYEITSIDDINTKHSEFCPAIIKDKFVFTSDRTQDLLSNTNDPWDKQPFLHEYYVDIIEKKDSNLILSSNPKLMPWPINTNYHDGPMCFDEKTNTMYITRVNYETKRRDKNFVNRPQIFSAVLVGNKWEDMKPFKYNNVDYTFAHPSVSYDGQWLYFSSNMPGGKGGLDIFRCHKENDGWGPPENLGDEINTQYDEMFPFVRRDGVLFFSSERPLGFGGLDIFSATQTNNKFSEVTNLGAPINSSTDDFGIMFTDELTRGYFSSDRNTGKGMDDIYSFKIVNKFIRIDGKLLLSQNINDPLKNVEIKLLDEDGKILNTTTTDSAGYFKFINLDPDIKYMITLDETNPALVDKDKVFMANTDDRIVRVIVINDKGGKFVFSNLPLDPNEMALIPIENDATFAGNLFYGNNPAKPLGNTKVNLVNDKGEIIGTTTTNDAGAFVFTNLPYDQNFIVKIDESDTKLITNTKISITNKKGEEIQSTQVDDKGHFNFRFPASDKTALNEMKVEDSELHFNFKGKLSNENNIPLVNSVINLVNEKGEVLSSTHTDAKGGFKFVNLPTDKTVLFALEESDSKLQTSKKLYLTDANGKIIKEFTRNEKGKFDFTLLPTDIKHIGELYVDNPETVVLHKKSKPVTVVKTSEIVKVSEPEPVSEPIISYKNFDGTVENLFYDINEYLVLPQSIKTLYKVVDIMVSNPKYKVSFSSYTDSHGTEEYNMELSNKRAKAAKDFLIVEGIDARRISATGYGETKLLNNCSDGVDCTDEQHAINRRTEINFSKK